MRKDFFDMKTYKGFDSNLQCRGFQYEIGKEYEEEKAEACKCGFHACEMPLDVFNHYPPAGSRFCEVEQSGEMSRCGSDSKVASTKIKIGAEIGIPGLVKAQVEWVKEQIGFDDAVKKANESPDEHATGYQGAASATGDQGAASATGNQGAASATGRGGIAVASGYEGKVMGALGCAIVCCERGDWDGETYPLLAVVSAIVDGEVIKADTWYTVKDGKFVEVEVQ